jgi:hypothetical protein
MTRPVLLYAGRCPRCRFLSRLIVALSLGMIERVPLDRAEAERFYYVEHPDARGRPALVDGDRMVWGWPVVPATFRVIGRTWIQKIRTRS